MEPPAVVLHLHRYALGTMYPAVNLTQAATHTLNRKYSPVCTEALEHKADRPLWN